MSVVWLGQKFLKEIESQKESVKDIILAGTKDFSQYQYLCGRYSSLVDTEDSFRELLGKIQENVEDTNT